MSYTKGEWFAEAMGNPESDPRWLVSCNRAGSGDVIDGICVTVHGNDEANAKFIAKARNSFEDLYEACKIFSNSPKRLQDDLVIVTMPRKAMPVFHKALSKAEGK